MASEQKPAPRKYRKKIFIYPEFQLVLIAGNVAALIFIFGMGAVQSYRTLMEVRQAGERLNLPSDHPYFNFVDTQFRDLFSSMSFAFILGALLSVALTLMISHRLAGPLVRLRSYFTEISNKGLAPGNDLRFRKGDFFSDFPPIVNKALANVRDGGAPKES